MSYWAEKMVEKELNEFKTNVKMNNKGDIQRLRINDYLSKDNWGIKEYGYKYPGIIEIVMKNINDSRNPKRIYRQEVSDSYMTQISLRVYGHSDYEKTEHFNEESLIRKNKKL